MTSQPGATHRPDLKSWVASAHAPGTDFPIQNLPFGVYAPRGGGRGRVGIAIGDRILDVSAALEHGLLDGAREAAEACRGETLNALMALGAGAWSALRQGVSDLLRAGSDTGSRAEKLQLRILVPQDQTEPRLPAAIGDYTDFYASVHHATNVGSMFRPDSPLLPNYKHLPVGYHGRASSVVVSGTPVRRPLGQTEGPAERGPVFGPSRSLDYELEVGAFVGPGNALGEPIPIGRAEEHLFGLCLLNDWSARDAQRWEYQPLGPFLAKNFATSISPWVVTMEALAPFRAPPPTRPAGDPAPLPYLSAESDRAGGAVALTLEVWLATAAMRERRMAPVRLSRGSFGGMYWTLAQMLTHHASNGCNLRPGDLLGSGTVSGPERDSCGSLLELAWRGTEPVALPGGDSRKFLEDGDEVILRGYCERDGSARIGFGECRGTILPAPAP